MKQEKPSKTWKMGNPLGVDGIPIEFYKEFLETIILDLRKTFNETLFTNKKTSKSWNQAIKR